MQLNMHARIYLYKYSVRLNDLQAKIKEDGESEKYWKIIMQSKPIKTISAICKLKK